MYLHQKIIRIYADIVQNHTLPGVFPNFWRAVYLYIVHCIAACVAYIVHSIVSRFLLKWIFLRVGLFLAANFARYPTFYLFIFFCCCFCLPNAY